MITILHGDILWADENGKLITTKNSYLIGKDGIVEGVFPVLPEEYRAVPVAECGNDVVIPAFADLHVHASQYVERGLGMDMLLYDWLNDYTFPQEARFASPEYAEPIYDAFIDDLIRNGTFASCCFTTIHRDTAGYLIRKMEDRGLFGLVGKVNMDMGAPDYLTENVSDSLKETERFLADFSSNKTAKPILTPRFAPTCTEELMNGLGKLGKKYGVGVQTHLVESKWEAAEALRCFPNRSCDTEIYEKAGLLDNGPVVGAHFIFPSQRDTELMLRYNGFAVHCPDATTNIIAGIMPAGKLRDAGMRIALGSDVGGGHNIGVYTQVSRAVQLSKLKWFYEQADGNRTLSFPEAFAMATRAGGSVFGKLGAFEKGYVFNALVIGGLSDKSIPLTPEQTAERFCYIGGPENIHARYLSGKKID